MPKGTQADKEFYYLLRDKIHSKLLADGNMMCKDEVHIFLKAYADLANVSLATITHEQLQILKEYSKQFAYTIGIDIDISDGISFNF
jgi:hypothetical protein